VGDHRQPEGSHVQQGPDADSSYICRRAISHRNNI
jgi:hypothetical protein